MTSYALQRCYSAGSKLSEDGFPPGMNVTVTVIINAAIAARANIVEKPPAPSYNQAIEGTAAAETVKDKTYFIE